MERHQIGPVTQAIRAMRAADASANLAPAFTHAIHALSRAEVETLIEGLTDLLAAYDRVGEAA